MKNSIFSRQISFRHEKAEDYRKYMNIVNDDFSVQYKEILKDRIWGNLVPTQNITITDTVIFNKGNREEYLVIQGRALILFEDFSAEQRVLAKNYGEIKDVFSGGTKIIPVNVC